MSIPLNSLLLVNVNEQALQQSTVASEAPLSPESLQEEDDHGAYDPIEDSQPMPNITPARQAVYPKPKKQLNISRNDADYDEEYTPIKSKKTPRKPVKKIQDLSDSDSKSSDVCVVDSHKEAVSDEIGFIGIEH